MNPIRFIQLLFVKDRKFAMSLYPVIGYIPHNIDFYKIPFIHKASSVIMHDGYMINNERLEYLGDAVLDAVIAEYLFDRYPDKNEGFLSQMRSKLVKRQNLNSLGLKLGLDTIADPFITNNNLGKNFYGDVLEAMIGAIYHDKGYNCARRFVIGTLIEKHINLSEVEMTETDFKSRVIEWAQKNRKDIQFDCKEEYSSSDRSPMFICSILFDNEVICEGTGSSKKEAEQNAAEVAFRKIDTFVTES